MRATESFVYTNQNAGDVGPFSLVGGIYQISAVCGSWGGGSAQLFSLGPDGSTWLSVSAAITANGGDTIYLPPGSYKWTITTSSGVSVGVVRVPCE